MQMQACDVAVVGAGLSGSLTVINLLRCSTKPLRIVVFEKEQRRIGRGVAYSNAFDYQPLNVTVEGMTLFADKPLHFYDWLKEHKTDSLPKDFSPLSFVSRRWFGSYLNDQLDKAITTNSQHDVTFIKEEIVEATRRDGELVLQTSAQKLFSCNALILAIGNFQPATIPSEDLNYVYHPHYEPNPWRDGLVESIGANEKVLFVGSGLTMIDLLINLKLNGHAGKTFILSRNGRLPSLHKTYVKSKVNWNESDFHQGVLHLLKVVRAKVNELNCDWRNVIDSLREHTPYIWKNFSSDDKRIFFRRLRSFWDAHRHRVPEASHGLISDYIAQEQATMFAGKIQRIVQHNGGFIVTYQPKASTKAFSFFVHRLINCTGPESNYKNLNQPLVRDLLYKGYVQQDPTSLGLLTDNDGRLIDSHHKTHTDIFTLGPVRKGMEWESTALREIRLQAVALAETVLQATAKPRLANA